MTTRSRSVGSPDATRAVDWEQRIDFPRLRRERLDRAKAALEASDLGALLLFDPNNIRYVTSTHIGEWARDKNARFALLPRGGDPILWDFGSAARHHQRPAGHALLPRCCTCACSRRSCSPVPRRPWPCPTSRTPWCRPSCRSRGSVRSRSSPRPTARGP